jgi:hypothetical protein
VHGEIVGQGFAFNSNLRVRSLGVQLQPANDLRLHVLHYRFQWDQAAQFGGTDQALASETNVLVDWQPRRGMIVYAGLSTAKPYAGAGEYFTAFGDGANAALRAADQRIWRFHLGIEQQF